MDKEVLDWIKRANRKKAKLIDYENGRYTIVYFHNKKVRVGFVQDSMFCRYGIKCFGAMTDESIYSLWQAKDHSCSPIHVQYMQCYLKGTCDLPDFDFSTIKDLRH